MKRIREEGDLAGDVVVMEDPTYWLAERIFTDLGLKTEAIPIDEQGLSCPFFFHMNVPSHGASPSNHSFTGLRVDLLEEKLKEGVPVRFVYTIPVYQNPTGAIPSFLMETYSLNVHSREKAYACLLSEERSSFN